MVEAVQVFLVGPVDQERAARGEGDGDVPLPLAGDGGGLQTRSRSCTARPWGLPSHERREVKESWAKYLPPYPLIRSMLRRTPSGSTITFGNPRPPRPWQWENRRALWKPPRASRPSVQTTFFRREMAEGVVHEILGRRIVRQMGRFTVTVAPAEEAGRLPEVCVIVALDALHGGQKALLALVAQVPEGRRHTWPRPEAQSVPNGERRRGPACSTGSGRTPG